MNIKHFEFRGLPIFWIEEGDKNAPILVFIHGFPDDAFAWSKQIDFFSEKYHIIAPFLPGVHKGDAVPETRFELDSLCLNLLQILKHVDPEQKRPVVLVAHDLGGAIAHQMHFHLQTRLKGLIFINSMGRPQFLSRYKNLRQVFKSYYIYLFQIPFLPDFLLKKYFNQILEKIHNLAEVSADDPIRTQTPIHVLILLNMYRQLFQKGLKDAFEANSPCPVPSLFIWGERDSFLEIPSQDELEHFYTQTELRVLEGNHWIHRAQSGLTNQAITKFLEKNLC